MLTPEEAKKRADQLSKIIDEKMDEFIEPLKEQQRWLEYELKNGVLSEQSRRITESDKDLLKTEVESIIQHHTKAISSMKAIKTMCK